MNQKFNKAFVLSLFLHIMLLLAWMLFALAERYLFFDKKTKAPLSSTKKKSSIRVDIVDLPDQRIYDMRRVDLSKKAHTALNQKSKPKKAKPSKEALVMPEVAKAQALKEARKKKRALEKKKKNERLSDLRKRLRADARRQELINQTEENLKEEEQARPALAGNEVSQGDSLKGEVADTVDEYRVLMKAHIQKFWHAPGWMLASNNDYRVRILVKLSPGGHVLSKEFLEKSGSDDFDAAALEAISSGDPFPKPPVMLRRKILEEGIEWGFPE